MSLLHQNTPNNIYFHLSGPRRTSPQITNSRMNASPAEPDSSPPAEPFLSLSTTPVHRTVRVWRSHCSPAPAFTIYEDPPNEPSPRPQTPVTWWDDTDDKENEMSTASDYETPGQVERETEIVDYDPLQHLPLDVFGAPFEVGFASPLTELPLTHDDPVLHAAAAIQPGIAVRRAMRVRLMEDDEDEDENEEEWNSSLSSEEIEDLQQLGDVFARGTEQHHLSGRQYSMREDNNIQIQANILLETRRITEYQRHQQDTPSEEDED